MLQEGAPPRLDPQRKPEECLWLPRFVFIPAGEILEKFANGEFEDARLFDLRIQAEHLSLSRGAEYAYSVLASRATLYPHQVGVVCKVLAECKKGALLADEVGLGKTVEAGMVLKELACRGRAKRVLILAPSALLGKWVQELENRFGEKCAIYDAKARSELRRRHVNVWEANPRIVCSIDTAKQPRHREEIAKVDWDLVVVDEAHRLRNASTENHKLLLALKRKVTLLLTATPMHNSINELYNLVSLVDRAVLGTPEYFKTHFVGNSGGLSLKNAKELRQRLQAVMVRNLKKGVYLGMGQKLTGRVGQTLRFDLSPQERELYDQVSRYASGEYLKALRANDAGRGFLLILMQRLVCSSSFAIRDFLRRRIERLRWVLQDAGNGEGGPRRSEGNSARNARIGGIGGPRRSMPDDEAQELADGAEGCLDGQLGRDSGLLGAELEELERLHAIAQAISANSKGEKLLQAIGKLAEEEPDAKVLVFTEFRSTQDYLVELLERAGYGVVSLNGSLTRDEKEAACISWRDDASKRVMVSTEVGGEGKDFQFCHILFNYDLPWNPMRVEQRIGRLDRIGQSRTVRIFNLSTAGTVEEHVLNLLDEKIGLFRKAIGDVDIILGNVAKAENKSFQQVIMEIHAQAVTMEAEEEGKRFRQLASKIEAARRAFENGIRHINKAVWSNMDLSVWREVMGSKLEQHAKVDQERIRSFFLGFLETRGASTTFLEKDVFRFSPPGELAAASEGTARGVVTATFDPSAARKNHSLELVSFGSNLLSAAVDASRTRGACAKKDVRLGRVPEGKLAVGNELLNFNFKVSIGGLVPEERLVPVTLGLKDGSPLRLPEESIWFGGIEHTGDVRIGREKLDRMYERALEMLRLETAEWVETVKEKCQSQYRKEATSINEYYVHADDALREQEGSLQRQCESALKRKNEAKTYDAVAELDKEYMRLRNQLARLKRNNQRKRAQLGEALDRERLQLMERSKITVTVSLVNIAYLNLAG
ncbi:MAG: SNF2-related protein [Thermoproteota archaeon]